MWDGSVRVEEKDVVGSRISIRKNLTRQTNVLMRSFTVSLEVPLRFLRRCLSRRKQRGSSLSENTLRHTH